jgi:putative PIN family toxin of toxin-antitoxin system
LIRLVLDTNILVSFAIRLNAAFEKVFDYVAAHGAPLVSEETLLELFTVLSRDKFRRYLPIDQSLDYVDWYAGISDLIAVTEKIVACRDPKDDKFLALAIAGKADCILAEDNDLLDMVTFRGIPIYRPSEFIERFIEAPGA